MYINIFGGSTAFPNMTENNNTIYTQRDCCNRSRTNIIHGKNTWQYLLYLFMWIMQQWVHEIIFLNKVGLAYYRYIHFKRVCDLMPSYLKKRYSYQVMVTSSYRVGALHAYSTYFPRNMRTVRAVCWHCNVYTCSVRVTHRFFLANVHPHLAATTDSDSQD